jgi:hypothetical protein
MSLTPTAIWGLAIGFAIGLFALAIYQRMFYAILSRRHERAKLHGERTLNPARLSQAIWVLGLVVLPAVLFLLGLTI